MVFGGRTREAEAREKEKETEEPAGCRWSGRELGRWCEEEERRSGEGKSQKREGPVRAAERRTRRPGRVGPFQQGADTRHRVEKLLEEVGGSVSQPAERICVILQTAGGRSEVPCEDTPSSPPLPNLSCMEPELHPYPTPSTSVDTLFPEEITPGYPSTPEDVLPTYLLPSCRVPSHARLFLPVSWQQPRPHPSSALFPPPLLSRDGPSSSGRGHSHVNWRWSLIKWAGSFPRRRG